jgi:hypothetical protein
MIDSAYLKQLKTIETKLMTYIILSIDKGMVSWKIKRTTASKVYKTNSK